MSYDKETPQTIYEALEYELRNKIQCFQSAADDLSRLHEWVRREHEKGNDCDQVNLVLRNLLEGVYYDL